MSTRKQESLGAILEIVYYSLGSPKSRSCDKDLGAKILWKIDPKKYCEETRK